MCLVLVLLEFLRPRESLPADPADVVAHALVDLHQVALELLLVGQGAGAQLQGEDYLKKLDL